MPMPNAFVATIARTFSVMNASCTSRRLFVVETGVIRRGGNARAIEQHRDALDRLSRRRVDDREAVGRAQQVHERVVLVAIGLRRQHVVRQVRRDRSR